MSIAVFDTSNSTPRSVECDEYLSSDEIWWQDHQVWLEQCGYMLRPRYRPGWVPSWVGTKRTQYMCEDGQDAERGQVLDATRLVDGAIVVLKKVMVSRFPHEIEISRFLSSPALAKDPRNHCVPVYDVLSVPDNDDLKLLVMPLLHEFYSPKFLTVGEAVECCRQIIEGMQFMHSHRVAHRDCGLLNIMMDPKPLFPKLFHFATPWLNTDISGRAKHSTRTSSPTKYFYIDFGISRKFDPAKGPPRAWPIRGADKTVPEFAKSTDPCDPLPTDIYYLGNTIRTALLQEYRGLEFMKPLVDDMVQDDPSKRPTIDDVAARFDILLGSLWWWKLRSRLRRWNEHWIERPFRVCAHIFRTVYYIITCTPALPRP
ncbi:hypothetical protein PYCCODRAFT_1449738 [Trametes coccinea BRFM310]|uniref:Protein kinase domain-containing protein n=1 Tax=Trametes coccinea (strain BRFM310) TaxID=1353009 RepID=A0A1Y2J0T3_TRAC3|nr:hypothetical protein PYCCODRAFT_1449738 [Trametes coccinea BRFM310]